MVHAAFKPSKHNAYSFMTAPCSDCGITAVCVAYVGEPDALSQASAAIAATGDYR